MILCVDASNICSGGGLTHLREILGNASPTNSGFDRVIVWGNTKTLSKLCEKSWLEKVHASILDGMLPRRIFWQQVVLPKLLKQNGCKLLFSPGGTLPVHVSVPTVTMSRNLLPFEPKESARYSSVLRRLRFKSLNIIQKMSFQKADGVIFLTKYAQQTVCAQLKKMPSRMTIIPHGINRSFILPPRNQKAIDFYTPTRPFRLLYVSIVDVYKHQWHVAKAVSVLRGKGFPVVIDFVGFSYPEGMRRFKETLLKLDSNSCFIRFKGSIPYSELCGVYHGADAFVFASSCENMPNILLEAMASGLPIACSNRGPMPEVLGDAGVYFDPENTGDIAQALLKLIQSPELRAGMAKESFRRAQAYSWTLCAHETFRFLSDVASDFCRDQEEESATCSSDGQGICNNCCRQNDLRFTKIEKKGRRCFQIKLS